MAKTLRLPKKACSAGTADLLIEKQQGAAMRSLLKEGYHLMRLAGAWVRDDELRDAIDAWLKAAR